MTENQLLRDALKAASNYIDTLGGVSTSYRAALSHPAQSEGGEVVGYLYQCRKKPSLKELRFTSRSLALESMGYKAYPLTFANHPPASQEQADAATSAGTQAAMGHLSRLVDEATGLLSQLRTMVDDMHKQWSNGGLPERGEFPLLDSVDDWLGARPSQEQAQQPQAQSEFASEEVQRFVIEVEKLLCQKLGRKWAPSGMSIQTLVDELATKPQAQAQELPDERAANALSHANETISRVMLQRDQQWERAQRLDLELEKARAALAAKPDGRPMTDGEMWSLWNAQGIDDMNQQEAIAFARAIEAHHGITSANGLSIRTGGGDGGEG